MGFPTPTTYYLPTYCTYYLTDQSSLIVTSVQAVLRNPNIINMTLFPNHISSSLKFLSKSIAAGKSWDKRGLVIIRSSIPWSAGTGCKRAFGMSARVSGAVGGGEGEGKRVRRFAPLKGSGEGEGKMREVDGVRRLRGIIFDMDGTLW